MKIEKLHQLFLNSKGIATDTRKIEPGQIFFALKGDNFNGNKFAKQALETSENYAVIDEKEYEKGNKYILVNNVLETLQQLASFHRNYLKIPILAITGSNGKTTTKELIHAVLKNKFNTVATTGNLNNHIGVPLTLLGMDKSTEFGIVEMGANHPGEIAALCQIAQPDYGFITNFGKAHLEGFKSLEGVIKAKSELYHYLKENDKLLFLNDDDELQRQHLSYKKSFSFGTSNKADVVVKYSENKAEVVHNKMKYSSALSGNYNAKNIASAICIGRYFEISPTTIQKAILSYSAQNNRSQLIKINSTYVLLDAYNANPTSLNAALESFNENPATKKALIIGDMLELGKFSEEEHQEIVSKIENMDFQKIFLFGSNFSRTTTKRDNIQKFEDFKKLEKAIRNTDFSNSHLLIKGSRSMALERIVPILKEKKIS